VRNYRFAACLVCILGCGVMAAAQDKTYSADSLLATFQKGSSASVKGAEIKFAGVIAEIKKSRVVFKGSGDDKIICELVSPLGTGKDGPVVGGPLTVIGKVRGRGIMGNITLDPCVRVLAEPEAAPTPAPVVVPEPVPEKVEPPVVIPEPEPAPVAELPPSEAPTNTPAPRVSSAPSSKVSIPARPLPAAEPVVENAASHSVTEPKAVSSQTVPMETSVVSTIRLANYLPLFVASAIGMGIGAILVFMKMRPATAPAFRSACAPTPQEERRAALEALLLGKKKGRK
jgi:hypothetical protein